MDTEVNKGINNVLYNTIASVIIGHAVGDALGVPREFYDRDILNKEPITGMIGYGTHNQPAGVWSDDTSMTLATLDKLGPTIQLEDVINGFIEWYTEAEYTARGELFDIGNVTAKALNNHMDNKLLDRCGCDSDGSNGNGSLMRIAPAVLYLEYGQYKNLDIKDKLKYIHNISALTHAHTRSLVGCGIYALVMWEILRKREKGSIYKGLQLASEIYKNTLQLRYYSRLIEADISKVDMDDIKSSGYIVDTLEAAMWCLLTTETYKDCVLKAVNLGDDTDTVAAIAGSLAGALYGYNSIPDNWIKQLARKEYIHILCAKAASRWEE